MFQLVVITNPGNYYGEQSYIEKLFASGLELLHLRKPECSSKTVAAWISVLPENCHSRIVLHSHYELLNHFGLKGIHLPQAIRQAQPKKIHKLASQSCSTSCHSLTELQSLKQVFDYIFLSPIFNSISKPDRLSMFKAQELEDGIAGTKGIFALGGVNEQRVAEVKRLGFSGAALLGAIWQTVDPVQSFERIRRACTLFQDSHEERK